MTRLFSLWCWLRVFLFHYFMATFQQETMWVNINLEGRDLTSAQKLNSPPQWIWRNLFSFNLIKQNRTHFSFIFLTRNLFSLPMKNLNLNYSYQVLYVSSHRINDDLPGCSSAPLSSVLLLLPLLYMQPYQTAIFKSR